MEDVAENSTPEAWGPRQQNPRCSAKRSNGEPCARYAISGGTVCPTHGGSAPQVKAAARARLEALVPAAIETLGDLAQGIAKDPTTGAPVDVPPRDRARAADSILNRVGITSAQQLEVAVEGTPQPGLDARILAALDRRGLADGIKLEPPDDGDDDEAAAD